MISIELIRSDDILLLLDLFELLKVKKIITTLGLNYHLFKWKE